MNIVNIGILMAIIVISIQDIVVDLVISLYDIVSYLSTDLK